MKRRRKTTSVSYELKKAVIRLERCDASDCPVSKVAHSVLKSLPHVDIVDYSKIQEHWTHSQYSHLSAHKSQIKKKKPVTEKSSQKIKKRCDRKIVINDKTCPDILTTEVSCAAISVVKAGSLDISAIGRCLLEASIEESSVAEPGKEGCAAPEACHEVSDITASCLDDVNSAEISIQDEMLAGSCSLYTEAVETGKDYATLMETGEEKDLIRNANEFKIERIPDGVVGLVNCRVVDSEMSLLVSEDVEKMAVTEEDSTTEPRAADSLYPFDEMPLLSIEGDCLMNLDHCLPDNLVNGEQMEGVFVPDHSSDLFLCENPSAVFTSLNSDVMLGDIGNRLSLFEEEVELLAVSGGKSMETVAQETVDFGDSGFAVDELDWNCEQTWPLLDPVGDSIQNGQGLLSNSIDAKDSEDEFRQKMTEEVFARQLSSLRLEDQEKRNLRNSLPRHLDSLVDCAIVEDNIVVASDKKFDANKSDAFPQNTKQRDGEHQEGKAVEDSLDGDHQQKSSLPTIKQKEVKFLEDDQKEFKMKPLMNFSLTSNSKSFRDFKEEKSSQRRSVATSTDIRKCDDKSILSKTLLKGCEAAKLKCSEVRKKKEIDAVDEMQRKIVRVSTAKSSFQKNKQYSATAHHNSISCDEKRSVHCVQRSLCTAHDQSFINQNAAFGFPNADKPGKGISVSVQKTGNLLEDHLVSTESSLLQTSLHCCPALEVLQPKYSSQNSKEKLSVKSKTPFISNRHQPLSREGVLDAELDTVTQKSKKKDQLDVGMNHRVLRVESDGFSSAVQKAERLKTDLEILRNKIRSDLCDLLLARLESEMPSVRVTNMAFDIEFELWSVSKHLSSIYKQRASSLMRILRRSSSQRLCDRLFSSDVKPHHLVQNMTRYLHNAIVLKGTEKESIMSHSDVLPEMTFSSDQHELQAQDVGYRNRAGRTVVSCSSLEHSQEQMVQRPSNAKLPKIPEESDKEKQQSVSAGVENDSFQQLTRTERSCEAVQLCLREVSLDAETVNNVLSSSCTSPCFTSSLPSTAPDEVMSNASSSLLQSALSFGLTVTEEAHGPLICSVDIDSVMNSLPDVIVDDVVLGSSLGSRHPPDEPQRLSNATDKECCLSGVDGPPTISTDQSSSSSVNARAVNDDGFRAVPHIIVSKNSEVCQSNDSLQNPTTCSNENGLSSPNEAEFLHNCITEEVTIKRDVEKMVDESLETVETTSFLLLSSNDSSTSLEISDSMSSSSLKPVTHSARKQTAADDRVSIEHDVEPNMLDNSTDVLHEVENICGSDSKANLLRNISVNESDTCPFKSALEMCEMNALSTEEKLLPFTTTILVELNELESSVTIDTYTLIENSMALDESLQNTVNSDKNSLSVKPDEFRDNTAKEFSDLESYSELVSDDNAAVSHEATHSKDCQEDLDSNTLNASSVVSLDAVNSSGDAEKMKSAISDLFPVAVLDEESCQTFSDHFVDLCGAQTTVRQEKVVVELNKTTEKVSDIENEKIDCKSEFLAGAQFDGLVLDLDQGSLNRNECVLKPMQLDNAESLQSGNSGNVEWLERQHSRADDSIVSAAECGHLDSENLSNEVCLASLQTELDKSSQYKQTDSSQLSYLNRQDQTLKSCTVVKTLLEGTDDRRDVAASVLSSCAQRAAQAPSEIPSYVLKTNTESILPVVCDSSAVVMPSKSVVSVSSTMASVCSVPNPSQSTQLYSISEFSCASSAGSSSLVSSSTGSTSERSSSVLFGCNQIQNHSLFLPKDIGPSQLPLSPRCPLLLSRARFLTPQQLSQQRAPNKLFPIHSRDSLCKAHSQSNVEPNPKSPLSPVVVRNPLLPRLENQTTWQSRGHHKGYDDAFACKTFQARGGNVRSYFLNFSNRMAVRPLLESQSSRQFRQPLIELKIRPFAKNNGSSERPQDCLNGVQRMTENSDAYHSSIDSTLDGSANRHLISNSEGQNLAGQPTANSFCIVHEDSEFPQPDNSTVSNHRNLFNSTYLEENYSGNSYEFFGSSEENLEKFMPHFIPMSAIDYLDKSADNDNEQVNVKLCSRLGFNAEGNDFANSAEKNKIMLQPSDNIFFNNRELRREQRSESADESVGRTMADVDRRLSNHEINSLRNGFGLDCSESLRIPDCSFPKTKSTFRSFDANKEIASIEADTFSGSDRCRFRDQSSIAGQPHRARRYAEEMELPIFRDSFHLHRQNYGREISSNQAKVDLPFANSRGSRGHEPFFSLADRNQRCGTEQHRGFASDNGFCLSLTQLREDDCTSGCETDEPSGHMTRPVLLQNLSGNRQRQNFSRGFKRRRLEDRSSDERRILHHGLNERVADEETSDLISCDSSEQVYDYRHGRFFRPESHQNADLRRSSFHYSVGDNRIEPWTCRSPRRHLIDYELRPSEFMSEQGLQEMADIRQRLCDIAEGHKGSCGGNRYQHCAPFGINEHQTGSKGRISYDVVEAEGNMLFGFSSGAYGSILDEDPNQGKEMVYQWNSSDELKYLRNDGFTSREKKPSLNRRDELRRNYEHFGHYDGNRSLFHGEQSGSCRVSRTKDDESWRRRGNIRPWNRYEH